MKNNPVRPPRVWLAKPGDDSEASTYGWDTVFAVRVDDANALIRNAKSSPASFSCTLDEGYQLRGSFGDWQIGLGGDCKLIHFYLPLVRVEIQSAHGTHAVEGVTAEVELRLQFVPQPKLTATGGTTHHLRVDAKAQASQQAATVCDLHVADGQPALGFVDDVALRSGLEQWLNANLSAFTHVFSVIEVGEHAEGAFAWLKPTSIGYAYVDGPSADESLLGVLCMTEGRSAARLLPQLSANAIPRGARAGFLISQTMFLENILLPNLPGVFKGSATSDFGLMEDLRGIEALKALTLSAVEHEGKSYTPTLEQMNVRISEQEIHFMAQTRVEISPGIYSHCEHHSFLTIVVEQRANGPTFAFKTLRDPTSHDWTTHDEGIDILEEILAIIAAVVGVLVTILTGGAAAVAVILIAGLIYGVAKLTPEILAAVGTDDAPALDLMTLNATKPIRWTDGKDFTPLSAALNGSLQLGGNAL